MALGTNCVSGFLTLRMSPHPCHLTYCAFCYKAVRLDRADGKYDRWNKEGFCFCSYTSVTIVCGSHNYSIWAINNGIYCICHSRPVQLNYVCTLMSTPFYNYFNTVLTPGSLEMCKYECKTCYFSIFRLPPEFPSEQQRDAVKVTSLQLYTHYSKAITIWLMHFSHCVFI